MPEKVMDKVESDILEPQSIVDPQVEIDFSCFGDFVEDETRITNAATHEVLREDECVSSSKSSSKSSFDDDYNEAKMHRIIVQEDNIQMIQKDLSCDTCGELDEKLLKLIDGAGQYTESSQSNMTVSGEEESCDSTKFEFAYGNITMGTCSRDAKLITRSNSEYYAIQANVGDVYSELENNGFPTDSFVNDQVIEVEKETHQNQHNQEPLGDDTEPLDTLNTEISQSKEVSENLHIVTEQGSNESKELDHLKEDDNQFNPKSEYSECIAQSSKIHKENLSSAQAQVTKDGKLDSPKRSSPRTWRKRAIRLPAGKRHSRTIFFEEILAAYDIIDRSDVKDIESRYEAHSSMFSLASLKTKMRRILSADVEKQPGSESVSNGTMQRDGHGNKIIKCTIEKTNDGEPMQVITLAHIDAYEDEKNDSSSKDKKRQSSMIIYVDDLSEDDEDNTTPLLDGDQSSEIDSDRISVDSDDKDLVDGFSRKSGSYDVSLPDVREDINSDTIIELPSKSHKVQRSSQTSSSFGGIDKVKPETQETSRRVTFGEIHSRSVNIDATILRSVIPFDPIKNRLKKKTLPQEPFHLLTDGYPTMVPSFPSDRRSLIALEVYTTERTFVRGLEIIVLLFKARIDSSGYVDEKESELVFSNVTQILEFNRCILDEIYDRIANWSDKECIADVFLKRKNEFKMYADYCKSYDTGEALIKQKVKKKKELETLLNNCYANPVCLPGLQLSSYLITVIQRIPRYILLLKDLSKRTDEEHPDHQNLSEAVTMMEKIAAFINDQLKQAQCQKALEALQTQINGLKAYYIPERSLVHEGPVCLLTSKKNYQCVLFNDLLVYAVKGAYKQSNVELALELKTVWIEDLETMDPQTTKNDAIGIYTPDRPYTMYVGNSGEKKIWLKHLKNAIKNYLYHDKIIEDEVDLENRDTSYTYKDGSLYSGKYLNSKRHGEGTMMWPNQMTYRGNWLDDERNGFGVLEYSSGEIYEGLWKDDKQDGLGTFKYTNGDIISGEWKNGLRHGEIFINYKNGDKFAGQWLYDRIEGQGELICINGLSYRGHWSKNQKHGKGTLKFPDGSEYTGYLFRGKIHGFGEFTYANGSIYKGEFERGERCGQGSYTIPGGSCYDGNWMHDMKDGRGKILYENGDEYDGTWVQDLRIGQGVMVFNHGGYYRGQWSGDLKHGSGIMEFQDGSQYDGEWSYNKITGSGKMKYKDGSMFSGTWRDMKPQGKGILTKPGGWYCDGMYDQGKPHGHCNLGDPMNQYSYNGEWVNSVKEGMGIEVTKDCKFEGEFLDDLRHGSGTEVYTDGTVYKGQWKFGQKHGQGEKKHVNGLNEKQIWENGCMLKSPILLSPREMPPIVRWA